MELKIPNIIRKYLYNFKENTLKVYSVTLISNLRLTLATCLLPGAGNLSIEYVFVNKYCYELFGTFI
jgi:hypothetical protein